MKTKYDISKRIDYTLPENICLYDEIDLTFPAKVMHKAAGDFTEIYAGKLESPPQYFYAAFMTMLGAKLGSRVKLASPLNIQPRLYCILAGESASARKSTALEMAVPYFTNVHTTYSAASGQALARLLSEYGTVLAYYDELASLLKQTKQEASTLLETVTQLFSRNVAENQKSKRDESYRVEDAYFSLIAACTNDTYRKLFDESSLNIGFVNRLFIVPGEPTKRVADPLHISDEETAQIREWLLRIEAKYPMGTKIPKTANARQTYKEWYDALDVRSEVTKRVDEYSQRWALLMAISKLETEITKDTMLDAIDLMDWQLKVRGAYAPFESVNGIAAIEERAERVLRLNGKMGFWDLYRKTNAARYGGRRSFDLAVANMKQHNTLNIIKSGKKQPNFELTEDYYDYINQQVAS